MLGVSNRPHVLAHGVVPTSRPTVLVLCSALLLGAWPREALAEPGGAGAPAASAGSPSLTATNGAAPSAARQTEPEAPPGRRIAPGALLADEEPAPTAEDSYRGALTASYVLAPLVALAIGGTMAELEFSDEAAVLGGITAFLAPTIVHAAHGNTLGSFSFLGLAGATAGGVLLGGVAGHFLGQASCDPEEDSDGCAFASLGYMIIGSVLGGISGYTTFALVDVTLNGSVPIDRARANGASLQLWVNPVPAPRSERAGAASPFSGVQLGATLQL